jgi:hypothetical protein
MHGIPDEVDLFEEETPESDEKYNRLTHSMNQEFPVVWEVDLETGDAKPVMFAGFPLGMRP